MTGSTFATVTHVIEDGAMETHRIEFVTGDVGFETWKNFKAYWMNHAAPHDSDTYPCNTHILYVGRNNKVHEFRLNLTDEKFVLWLGQAEKQQEPWGRVGSGRRPQRVQRLTNWRERQNNRSRGSLDMPTGWNGPWPPQ